MRKSDLLAKIATLLAAAYHIPDDAELGYVHISAHEFPTIIHSDVLPDGKIEKSWHLKGEEIAEVVEAYGCEFKRIKKVEMVIP